MSRCKLDLPRLRAAEDELLRAKRSENTQRAYRTSWRAFERWAMEADLTAAPAEASTVRLFVLWCIDGAEYRLSSIRLHLAAIRAQHLDAGGNSPVDDRARNLVRAAARKLRQRPKKAEALSPFVLAAMSQALKNRGRLKDVRDRAMLLVGFAAGWRRSEIAAIDLANVEFTPEGSPSRSGRRRRTTTARAAARRASASEANRRPVL
jgi:site-specific recombinase XerD